MKKYSIEYERLLTLNNENDYPYFKGKRIACLSMYFEVRPFDKNGNEVIFTCDDNEEPKENGLNGVFRFDVDPQSEKGYTISLTSNIHKFDFSSYEIVPTVGFIGDFSKSPMFIDLNTQITHEEFVEIIKSNMEYFDYSNNKPAQNTAYGVNYIDE